MSRLRLITMLWPALLALGGAGPASGQDDPADAARRDAAAALAADQEAQRERAAWESERQALRARHDALRAEVAGRERRVARERAAVDALEARRDELERRLVEAERLTDSLEDTLSVLLDRLARTVAADVPFLPDERAARLATVRREVDAPDVPAADKLRRVLEAYQIEAAYGGTVELVRDAIDLDGREVHVEILRVGRLALFFRTPDGSRSGAWDPAAGAWVELDRDHHRAISEAIEMAARRRPVQVIGLPVGRIER